MKPAPFDYARPDTVEEALELLAQRGADARVLAGGQSLAAMLNMRLATPALLVDISGIEALTRIALRDGALEVGAAVTQAALERWPELAAHQPLLAAALPWIGHHATRQRGTVCGSLVHSDPSSELPLVLAVLGGEVVLQGPDGRRVVSAARFQTGLLQTDVRPDELVVAARFPLAAPGTRHAFREVSQRHGDFAIVALAAVADSGGVRLGVGGVADVPGVERFDRSERARLDDALNAFAWRLGGSDDAQASARYRRDLVRRLGRRIIEELDDARPGG